MKRKGKQGFTFVEVMTALALLAVLVVIAWGKFNQSYERALRATLMSDIRNLATAQELYYRLHLYYANDISLVDIDPSPKSTIHITEAHNLGWSGWNEIERTTEKCELYVGKNVTSSLGLANTSEKIFCGEP